MIDIVKLITILIAVNLIKETQQNSWSSWENCNRTSSYFPTQLITN